jgi:hypothetical protein
MDQIICHANGTCDMIFSNPTWDVLPIVIITLVIMLLVAMIYCYFAKKKNHKSGR